MQLPPSDHVIWKLAKLVVVCVVLVIMLKYNYLNGSSGEYRFYVWRGVAAVQRRFDEILNGDILG